MRVCQSLFLSSFSSPPPLSLFFLQKLPSSHNSISVIHVHAGGIDYQELNTILTFESMTTVCTQISIIDDDIPEERECFSVLAAPQPDGTGRNIRVVISNATVCIDDNGTYYLVTALCMDG